MPGAETKFSYIQKRIVHPLRSFIGSSQATGIILVCCTLFSFIICNTIWAKAYIQLWQKEIPLATTSFHFPHSTLHIINDVLMSIFFLFAGLEIKRELWIGELRDIKKSVLPLAGALGGMVIPALIYLLFCGHTPFRNGWGIPIATDIAFSLGVLSLLGKRIPLSWRIFLTALAIIDDIGGIFTIAVFYVGQLNGFYLLLAVVTVAVLILINILKLTQWVFYILPGLALWYFVYNSGIHATIAGVALAFTIPLQRLGKLESVLHKPVNFIILPLFALANTAIIFPADVRAVFASPLHYGIFFGLVLGKPIGICMFSFLAVKTRLAALPAKIEWKQLFGIGCIAGIGFTVSIFIATLAIPDIAMQSIAKVAIINASLAAGIIGFYFLKSTTKKPD